MSKWIETLSPAQLHDQFGLYHDGGWNSQMDRCWIDDKRTYCVTSRLLRTDLGKVEHVCITRHTDDIKNCFSSDGSRDIPWSEKMRIKNELFGEKRLAVEVFPTQKRLVDVCDCYHLWVFEKGFELPFGIHPKDKQPKPVRRGYLNFHGVNQATGEEISLVEMLGTNRKAGI